jgi:hypothetical protein
VDGQQGKGSLIKEAAFGFRYIFQRRSLLGFVAILFVANFFMGFPNSVRVPMILSRTGNDSMVLGSVQTVGSIALVIGSLLISTWGGFKRRMFGFTLGWVAFCIFGFIIFGLGRGLNVWILTSLLGGVFIPLGSSSSQSLLQAKVAPDVQGRVFAARRLLTWAPDMFTPLAGGALADYVMEPAMQSGGWLSSAFSWMVGTGPGSGMSLMMVFSGVLCVFTVLMCYWIPAVRNMEDILPDHDQLLKAEPEPA